MRKISIKKAFELRYGMKAPKLYIRLFRFVIKWWGWRNGKLEFAKKTKNKIDWSPSPFPQRVPSFSQHIPRLELEEKNQFFCSIDFEEGKLFYEGVEVRLSRCLKHEISEKLEEMSEDQISKIKGVWLCKDDLEERFTKIAPQFVIE